MSSSCKKVLFEPLSGITEAPTTNEHPISVLTYNTIAYCVLLYTSRILQRTLVKQKFRWKKIQTHSKTTNIFNQFAKYVILKKLRARWKEVVNGQSWSRMYGAKDLGRSVVFWKLWPTKNCLNRIFWKKIGWTECQKNWWNSFTLFTAPESY